MFFLRSFQNENKCLKQAMFVSNEIKKMSLLETKIDIKVLFFFELSKSFIKTKTGNVIL